MRLTETLQNRTSREPSSNRALNPDFGFIESTVSLMERGADDESVVGTLKTLSSDFSLQYNSSKNGSKNLEEEEWKKMRELLAQPSPPNLTKLLFKVGVRETFWRGLNEPYRRCVRRHAYARKHFC